MLVRVLCFPPQDDHKVSSRIRMPSNSGKERRGGERIGRKYEKKSGGGPERTTASALAAVERPLIGAGGVSRHEYQLPPSGSSQRSATWIVKRNTRDRHSTAACWISGSGAADAEWAASRV